MKTITAIYNAGRWIVICPVHGRQGAVLACDCSGHEIAGQSSYHCENDEYICPVCYPKIVAMMTVFEKGRVKNIPDRSARATARSMAEENDAIYRVVYPAEKGQIEQVLSERHHIRQRNWDGEHETLEVLRQQNHVIENYEKRKMILDPADFGITRGG